MFPVTQSAFGVYSEMPKVQIMNPLVWYMVTCCGVILLVLTDGVLGKKSFGCKCGKAKQGKTDYRKKRQSSLDTFFESYRKKRAIPGPSDTIINAGTNMDLKILKPPTLAMTWNAQNSKCHVFLRNMEKEEPSNNLRQQHK